jgi:hypothetical protein
MFRGYTERILAWRESGTRALGACRGGNLHANRLGQRGSACGEGRETLNMGDQLDAIRQCFYQA